MADLGHPGLNEVLSLLKGERLKELKCQFCYITLVPNPTVLTLRKKIQGPRILVRIWPGLQIWMAFGHTDFLTVPQKPQSSFFLEIMTLQYGCTLDKTLLNFQHNVNKLTELSASFVTWAYDPNPS